MLRACSGPAAIEVLAARTHNLKGVTCRIPHRQVTVVTGLSGAGKSSLAFDTVYAEAQRRFVESMSTYARQFLEQVERPPVEAMHNILPAVALEARNAIKNARSTVGTVTEVHDVLRLLFTHLGAVSCPRGHGPVRRFAPQEELIRQGYYRRWEEGELVRMEAGSRWLKALDPLRLVLGRFRTGDATARLASAIEEAYQLTGGSVEAVGPDDIEVHYGRGLADAPGLVSW